MWNANNSKNVKAGRGRSRSLTLFLLGCVILGSFLAGMYWNQIARSASPSAVYARAEASPATTGYSRKETREHSPDLPSRPHALARMEGEFNRQSAIILSCAELIEQCPNVFVALVVELHNRIPLIGLISSDEQRRLAENLLKANGLPVSAVSFLLSPVQTMWVRDYGPQFVLQPNGDVEVVDFISSVDAGDPYATIEDPVPQWIGWQLDLPVVSPPLRLEGGSFLTNGDGLCVTTTAVLENNSDLGYGTDLVSALIEFATGCNKWICLQPPEGEEMQHVDMFVAFLAENIAVVAECDRLDDPDSAAVLDEAAEALAGQQTSKGPMRVHRVPMPRAHDGEWRSYTNVVFANGVLLVPTYSDVDPANEEMVLKLYERLLPDWEIVGINADALIPLGGALHCLTVNVPRFVQIDLARHSTSKNRELTDLARASLMGKHGRAEDSVSQVVVER